MVSIRVLYFSTGGYVIHRIPGPGPSQHYSAWFERDGSLIDAELLTVGRLQTRGVSLSGEVGTYLRQVGLPYRQQGDRAKQERITG